MDMDFTPLLWFGLLIGVVLGAVLASAVWVAVI